MCATTAHSKKQIVNGSEQANNTTARPPAMGAREHTISTIALCMCSLINAYLQISMFPYAGFMVMHLNSSITQDNVGTRAGILASFFMVGRSLSAFWWGKAADVYGRVFVLQACLLLSAVFSILFGTSQSFAQALFWRFCLGFSNGIIGAAKTAATELAYGNKTLERRAMGLVMGMRSWGYLLAPALGGFLAEPVEQYSNVHWLQRDGLIHTVLAQSPYLAPNLLAAIACVLTAITLHYCMHETLPEDKRRHFAHLPADAVSFIYGSIQRAFYFIRQRRIPDESESHRFLDNSSNGGTEVIVTTEATDESSHDEHHSEAPTVRAIWSRRATRMFLIAHWSFAFVSMMGDEAFPLFCMSKTSGLALTEASIGKILSGAGVFFAISQYAVFATLVHRFGEYTSMTIGSVLGLQPSAIIPLSLLLNRGVEEAGVSWGTFTLLSLLMGTCKLFSCLYFTSLALSLNKTVPDSQRATMNGVVVVGASVARAIAPTFAGTIASFSFSSDAIPSRYGSLVLYSVMSLLGGLVCIRVWNLRHSGVDVEEHEAHQQEMVPVQTASESDDEGEYYSSEKTNESRRHEHVI